MTVGETLFFVDGPGKHTALWQRCRAFYLVRSIRTQEGLLLLDLERDMYCDLALLAGAVWLLMKWTPAGIRVKEIVDLLETAAPLPRHILETETCRLVASLARKGFCPQATLARAHE